MFVGVARFELFIPESSSLKTKRGVLRSVIAGAQNKFNASVAEVEYQDLWQRAAVGVSCVSDSILHCRKMLQEIERSIARSSVGVAEITGVTVEVVSLEDLS
jgi:uncharacterized protein YlxP (DUF503 family)